VTGIGMVTEELLFVSALATFVSLLQAMRTPAIKINKNVFCINVCLGEKSDDGNEVWWGEGYR
jgi:hypothetical protein